MRLRAPGWRRVPRLGAAQWMAPRALGQVVKHMGDRDLERRFAASVTERAVFTAMTRFFDPAAAEGFRGVISFELTRPVTGRESSWWSVSVGSEEAVARPGRASEAALRARVPVADFLRIAGGVIDPVEPVLAGRAVVSGELGTAVRLAEMFGAPRMR